MLEKLVSIKNIGKLQNLYPIGDVAFRKLSLVYGENGKGKTTACSIFRSLQSGDISALIERKTVAIDSSQECHIRIDGDNIKLSDGCWETTCPNLSVFDSEFVNQNVYSGDTVNTDHKKNLYKIAIGHNGVALARAVDSLTEKIRESNTDIRIKKLEVEKKIPNGISIDDFIKISQEDEVDKKIEIVKSKLKVKKSQVEESESIKDKEKFKCIKLPKLSFSVKNILKKTISDIDEAAGEKVSDHIQKNLIGKSEKWISDGNKLIKDKNCPFCGVDISQNQLIKAYRSYFNQEYNDLKQQINSIESIIGNDLSSEKLTSLQKQFTDNTLLFEFWKKHLENLEIPEIVFEDIHHCITQLSSTSIAMAALKQKNPLDVIKLSSDYKNALKNFSKTIVQIIKYNSAMISINDDIDDFVESLPNADILEELEKELAALLLVKMRFDNDVVSSIDEYNKALSGKTDLEEEKEKAKEELDTYCETVLQEYEENINKYLSRFNTGFRIINTRHDYRGGGVPRSQYQLKINNCPVGLEKFKTTLSTGDRNALAFAFFLSALDKDPNQNEKIVILDDPFTSLDRFRREATAQLSRNLIDKTKQVIIFSHDPRFLKLVYDKHDLAITKTLRFSVAGNGSVITEWDIDEELQSVYMKNFSILSKYYHDQNIDLLNTVRSIRPFLEGWLRAQFPGRFPSNEWLGDFIIKIRNADQLNPLYHIKGLLGEIEGINDYSKKFHHDQNPGADTEFIDHSELHGFVRRTLNLVGGID